MTSKEVSALSSLLGKLKTKSGQKPRKNNIPQAVPGASSSAVTSKPKKKRNRTRKSATMSEGAVKLSRRELVASVTTAVGQGATAATASGVVSFLPSTTSMPWLANLCKAFEQIQWHSASVEWVPHVGTTVGGSVAYGADWTSSLKSAEVTRTKVCGLTPVLDIAVWDRGTLPLQASRLSTRRAYSLTSTDVFDNSPCQIAYHVTSGSTAVEAGEFWVTYNVSLLGTRSV